MPDGRFISKSISVSEQVGNVSFEADFLFGRCIPHLDRDGRLTGNPKTLKAVVCPLRDELTSQKIYRLLAELHDAQLVIWYEVKGLRFLEFPAFARHQKGMHREREASSKIPDSQVDGAKAVTGESGSTPDEVRINSNDSADLVRLSKEKLSEVKISEVKVIGSDEPKPKSWVIEGSEWWAINVGSINAPRFGKALKDSVVQHGWPKVFEALKCYVEDSKSKGKPCRPEWCASEIVKWVEWSGMKATDENGDLTPRGRAIVGMS